MYSVWAPDGNRPGPESLRGRGGAVGAGGGAPIRDSKIAKFWKILEKICKILQNPTNSGNFAKFTKICKILQKFCKICENKLDYLVDFEKCCKMSIWS